MTAQPRGSKIIGTGHRVRTMLRKPANIAASSPATVQFTIFGIHSRQAKNLNVLSPGPNQLSHKSAILFTAYILSISLPERIQNMLKHRAWRCVSSIRDGLANGSNDLFHGLPVLH